MMLFGSGSVGDRGEGRGGRVPDLGVVVVPLPLGGGGGGQFAALARNRGDVRYRNVGTAHLKL